VPSSSPSAKRPGGGGGGTRGDGAVCVALELKKPTRTSPLGVEQSHTMALALLSPIAHAENLAARTLKKLRPSYWGEILNCCRGCQNPSPTHSAAIGTGQSASLPTRVQPA